MQVNVWSATSSSDCMLDIRQVLLWVQESCPSHCSAEVGERLCKSLYQSLQGQ